MQKELIIISTPKPGKKLIRRRNPDANLDGLQSSLVNRRHEILLERRVNYQYAGLCEHRFRQRAETRHRPETAAKGRDSPSPLAEDEGLWQAEGAQY